MAARSFGERLATLVRERESHVVLGLDPDPADLWPRSDRGAGDAPAARAAHAVARHCAALIDAAGPACVAVKPQLACFERLGPPGAFALAETVEHARAAGLLVIADAKRGDIDVSVRAYAQSLFGGFDTPFGAIPGLGVDIATFNPLMGSDTVEAALGVARQSAAALLVLVRTSNPGAADIEDLPLAGVDGEPTPAGVPPAKPAGRAAPEDIASRRDAAGRAARSRSTASLGAQMVWERLAQLVDELGRPGIDGSGVSDVGAVVGATVPEHLRRARELMPNAVMLLPGIGAQGGRVEHLAPVFATHRHGGLISASRSIAGAHRSSGGEPASAARAEAERLREQAWALSR